jgi:hypothetical protein
MNRTVSSRETQAFRNFLLKLPHGKDIVLVVLKGHLLLEEQVKLIVRERVRDFSRLGDARFGFYQFVCVANALTGKDDPAWVWPSLKKLNKLRNDIAHEMDSLSLTSDIEKFVSSVPVKFTDVNFQSNLELALWTLFAAVSAIVERPSASIVKLAKHGDE